MFKKLHILWSPSCGTQILSHGVNTIFESHSWNKTNKNKPFFPIVISLLLSSSKEISHLVPVAMFCTVLITHSHVNFIDTDKIMILATDFLECFLFFLTFQQEDLIYICRPRSPWDDFKFYWQVMHAVKYKRRICKQMEVFVNIHLRLVQFYWNY